MTKLQKKQLKTKTIKFKSYKIKGQYLPRIKCAGECDECGVYNTLHAMGCSKECSPCGSCRLAIECTCPVNIDEAV